MHASFPLNLKKTGSIWVPISLHTLCTCASIHANLNLYLWATGRKKEAKKPLCSDSYIVWRLPSQSLISCPVMRASARLHRVWQYLTIYRRISCLIHEQAVWIGRSHSAGRSQSFSNTYCSTMAFHSCITACTDRHRRYAEVSSKNTVVELKHTKWAFHVHCVVLALVDSGFLGGNKGAEANVMANVNSQTNLDLLKPKCLQLDSLDRLEKIYCTEESETCSPLHPQSTSELPTILIID